MFVTETANHYLRSEHTEPTGAEKLYLDAWIEEQYEEIKGRVKFTPSEVDPAQFLLRYENTSELLISTAHSKHPFLTKRQNARFRAIHDWHHIMMGFEFNIVGEYMAFEYAASIAPPAIHWILRSEIWYQAAAQVMTGAFQPQKLVKGCVEIVNN